MIRVFIDPQLLIFKMSGHSEFGPVGSDIVCAAATMLASMLVHNMTTRLDESQIMECELNSGHAVLKVMPIRKRMRNECRVLYTATLEGFELLAERYPEHVIID